MPDRDPVVPSEPHGDDIVSYNPADQVVPHPAEPSYSGFWIALVVGAAVFVAGLIVDSPVRQFAIAGLDVLPFLPLAVLANLGRRSGTFRALTLLYWVFLAGVMLLFSMALTVGAVADLERVNAAAARGGSPLEAFEPGGLRKFTTVSMLSAATVALGLSCFAGPVRGWLARWLPIERHSFADAVGLATSVALTLGCLIPVAVLGAPPLLLVLTKVPVAQQAQSDQSVLVLYYRLLWTLPVVFIAAGYPFHRSLGQTLRRLAFTAPRWWQWLVVPVATGALLLFIGLYETYALDFWKRMGWPVTDSKRFEEMLRFAITPAGAIAIGVMAGVTEELIFRGLFQPRLGLWLSALLFAAVHALQYNFDGLIAVFAIGVVLGYVRKYTNTTTAALVHGLYDFVLVYQASQAMP